MKSLIYLPLLLLAMSSSNVYAGPFAPPYTSSGKRIVIGTSRNEYPLPELPEERNGSYLPSSAFFTEYQRKLIGMGTVSNEETGKV